MWHLDHELDDWFKEVERKRKEKYGGSDNSSDGEPGEMMTNEFSPRGGRYAR
jgi:hypothetical protein